MPNDQSMRMVLNNYSSDTATDSDIIIPIDVNTNDETSSAPVISSENTLQNLQITTKKRTENSPVFIKANKC